MPSATRDRSVGRRISTFFSNSQSSPTSPSKRSPRTQSPIAADRPASRGRPTANRLQKTTDPFLRPERAPTSKDVSPLATPTSEEPPSDLSLIPPHVPFAPDGPASRNASPTASPRIAARRQDSQTGTSEGTMPPPGFHNPVHAPTAPGAEEPPPPLLAPPRSKTNSLESEKKSKRRSWMPGSRDKSASRSNVAPVPKAPKAWITGHADKVPYDVGPLIQGQHLSELWDDAGDTFVYFFPQSAQKGPSLRIHSQTFSSSPMLAQLAFGDIYSKRPRTSGDRKDLRQVSGASVASKPPVLPALANIADSDASSSSSSRGTRSSMKDLDDTPQIIHLYVPILSAGGALSAADKGDVEVTSDDFDALAAVRNMFSFLIGQSLIATEKRPTLFSVFMKIADSLTAYGFTNIDGSTYGEVAASSFDQYVDEMGLADVRASREKTIESIVLGERMRSVLLYNDAFTHAVGRYSDIQEVCQLPAPKQKFQLISQTTRNRMERASIDLSYREKSINLRLSNFDFPSVFAGILDSKTASERKQIRFNIWRDAFNSTRRQILGYYKHKFGSWPPKASSKKNNLETGGLNRLVMKEMYKDFSDIYDLYADRTSLTIRVNNDLLIEHFEDDDNEPATKILRRVFDEYDRAHVPIQPPIPFDVPLVPTLATVSGKLSFRFTGDQKADARLKQKKMSQEEASRVLDSASNPDTLARCKQSPFLTQFRNFEHKNAKNSTLAQIADFRCGMWIFLYAVMQALPLLAVDAPNVRFSHGVEYFLCEPPRSGVPWANPDALKAHGRVSRTWFGVAGGGVVSLPSDLVEHGVEGVYRRSHCWMKARDWSAKLGIQQGEVITGQISEEPQSVAGSAGGSSADTRTLRAPASQATLRNSAEHARSLSQPFKGVPPMPPMPFGNAAASRSMQNLSAPTAPGALAPPPLTIPNGFTPAPPGSQMRSASGTTTPRSSSADRRKSALHFGLEALPLPQGVSPTGMGPPSALSSQPGSAMHSSQNSVSGAIASRSRPVTREGQSSGKTFDDIIKDMEAEKPQKKGKKGR
ncbi:MAG: hypothetical protein Q9159_007270 [Coniocarpon cinnabarinum]